MLHLVRSYNCWRKDRCICNGHEFDDMEETADIKEEEPDKFEEIVLDFMSIGASSCNENAVAIDLMGDCLKKATWNYDQPLQLSSF